MEVINNSFSIQRPWNLPLNTDLKCCCSKIHFFKNYRHMHKHKNVGKVEKPSTIKCISARMKNTSAIFIWHPSAYVLWYRSTYLKYCLIHYSWQCTLFKLFSELLPFSQVFLWDVSFALEITTKKYEFIFPTLLWKNGVFHLYLICRRLKYGEVKVEGID